MASAHQRLLLLIAVCASLCLVDAVQHGRLYRVQNGRLRGAPERPSAFVVREDPRWREAYVDEGDDEFEEDAPEVVYVAKRRQPRVVYADLDEVDDEGYEHGGRRHERLSGEDDGDHRRRHHHHSHHKRYGRRRVRDESRRGETDLNEDDEKPSSSDKTAQPAAPKKIEAAVPAKEGPSDEEEFLSGKASKEAVSAWGRGIQLLVDREEMAIDRIGVTGALEEYTPSMCNDGGSHRVKLTLEFSGNVKPATGSGPSAEERFANTLVVMGSDTLRAASTTAWTVVSTASEEFEAQSFPEEATVLELDTETGRNVAGVFQPTKVKFGDDSQAFYHPAEGAKPGWVSFKTNNMNSGSYYVLFCHRGVEMYHCVAGAKFMVASCAAASHTEMLQMDGETFAALGGDAGEDPVSGDALDDQADIEAVDDEIDPAGAHARRSPAVPTMALSENGDGSGSGNGSSEDVDEVVGDAHSGGDIVATANGLLEEVDDAEASPSPYDLPLLHTSNHGVLCLTGDSGDKCGDHVNVFIFNPQVRVPTDTEGTKHRVDRLMLVNPEAIVDVERRVAFLSAMHEDHVAKVNLPLAPMYTAVDIPQLGLVVALTINPGSESGAFAEELSATGVDWAALTECLGPSYCLTKIPAEMINVLPVGKRMYLVEGYKTDANTYAIAAREAVAHLANPSSHMPADTIPKVPLDHVAPPAARPSIAKETNTVNLMEVLRRHKKAENGVKPDAATSKKANDENTSADENEKADGDDGLQGVNPLVGKKKTPLHIDSDGVKVEDDVKTDGKAGDVIDGNDNDKGDKSNDDKTGAGDEDLIGHSLTVSSKRDDSSDGGNDDKTGAGDEDLIGHSLTVSSKRDDSSDGGNDDKTGAGDEDLIGHSLTVSSKLDDSSDGGGKGSVAVSAKFDNDMNVPTGNSLSVSAKLIKGVTELEPKAEDSPAVVLPSKDGEPEPKKEEEEPEKAKKEDEADEPKNEEKADEPKNEEKADEPKNEEKADEPKNEEKADEQKKEKEEVSVDKAIAKVEPEPVDMRASPGLAGSLQHKAGSSRAAEVDDEMEKVSEETVAELAFENIGDIVADVAGNSGDTAKGDDAKGDTAKGDDAKGDDAKGDDAKGDTAKGDDAKGDGAKGDGAKGDAGKGQGAGTQGAQCDQQVSTNNKEYEGCMDTIHAVCLLYKGDVKSQFVKEGDVCLKVGCEDSNGKIMLYVQKVKEGCAADQPRYPVCTDAMKTSTSEEVKKGCAYIGKVTSEAPTTPESVTFTHLWDSMLCNVGSSGKESTKYVGHYSKCMHTYDGGRIVIAKDETDGAVTGLEVELGENPDILIH